MTFEEIYHSHWQKVFRLCMGYVNDSHLAKDIAQETFITVWRQLPKFKGDSNVGTWIFRIAVNHCLRQIEKKNKLVKIDLQLEIPEENIHSQHSKVEFLYRCISKLPELDRIIISLELEDVSQIQIAEIVGLGEGNVRVRIHRIKEKLTQKFKEYESE